MCVFVCVGFHRAVETMNEDTCKLFEKVAQKMGWFDGGGLDEAEKKVCNTVTSLFSDI